MTERLPFFWRRHAPQPSSPLPWDRLSRLRPLQQEQRRPRPRGVVVAVMPVAAGVLSRRSHVRTTSIA